LRWLLLVAAAGGAVLVWTQLRPAAPSPHSTLAGRATGPGSSAARALPPAPATDPTAPERAQAAVTEALRRAPGSLSTTGAVAPFDAVAFARHPKEYLSQVQPARCFQTARPGPDATPLEAQVPRLAPLERGAKASLWVRGVPSAPVTYTAFDGGSFQENGLSSVTVQADAKGLAVAHFVATPGLVGDLNIVAGSPLAVGVQRFRLRVVEHTSQD